jgi:acyl carrier protein
MAAEVEREIHGLLRERNPRIELTPDLLLGSEGLGLDSIALVEVLLRVEETFGIRIAAEMLAADSITVGTLTRRVETQLAS